MNKWIYFSLLMSMPMTVLSSGTKYVGENPHPILSLEYARYMNCEVKAGFAQLFSTDVVMLEASSKQEKMNRGLAVIAGGDPIHGTSTEELVAKKALESGIEFARQPEVAFKVTWDYCMAFTLKEHYYFDTEVSEIANLDDPERM